MTTASYTSGIVSELTKTLAAVPDEAMERLAGDLLGASRVFVAGAGRSGLMMRAFAMRLMHLGLTAYVVGEAVTPSLASGDLLLVGSGSGETKSLVAMAEKARGLDATVALATVAPASTLARLAATVVVIPAAVKDGGSGGSAQPMGSLFEQSLLLLLDAVVLRLMARQGIDAAAMFGRHANLE